jgi:hypothetical protein
VNPATPDRPLWKVAAGDGQWLFPRPEFGDLIVGGPGNRVDHRDLATGKVIHAARLPAAAVPAGYHVVSWVPMAEHGAVALAADDHHHVTITAVDLDSGRADWMQSGQAGQSPVQLADCGSVLCVSDAESLVLVGEDGTAVQELPREHSLLRPGGVWVAEAGDLGLPLGMTSLTTLTTRLRVSLDLGLARVIGPLEPSGGFVALRYLRHGLRATVSDYSNDPANIEVELFVVDSRGVRGIARIGDLYATCSTGRGAVACVDNAGKLQVFGL